jgi:hypothetical protein
MNRKNNTNYSEVAQAPKLLSRAKLDHFTHITFFAQELQTK